MTEMLRHDDWDVGQELARQQREMNRLRRRGPRSGARRRPRVYPAIIISATDDKLVVRAEVPGMKLEDFAVTVSGDALTIQGSRITGGELEGGWYHRRERERGSFSRAVRLPAEVDGEKAEAAYDAGVLAVSLPLKEAAKPKEIPVSVVEG